MASLWDWAVEAYARPGVEAAALALQDRHDQNVSFLLWAAWARLSDPAALARGAQAVRRWDETVLKPLRAVRRTLKPGFPPVSDPDRIRLREDVKAVELQAERILLETLGRVAGQGQGEASAIEALGAASAAWGSAPHDAIARLASALR